MDDQPTISTHVLDTERGAPGAGYRISLYRADVGSDVQVGGGETDEDGRIRRVLDGRLEPGDYRIEVEINGEFFVRSSITFRVDDPTRSYHVPLLLSPYSLTTYRGS